MTPTRTRAALAAFTVLGIAALAAPVSAETYLQTATAGNPSTGSYSIYGDGTNAGSNFIGATFALSNTATIADVGATFDGYASGDPIFAAIVSVPSLAGVPAFAPSALAGNALAETTFTPSAGDVSVALPVTLAAGTYAVVFGSGLFGATGTVGLADGNTTIGTPNIFASLTDSSFSSYGYDTGIRIYVDAPEPTTLALFCFAVAALGFTRRRAA